MATPRKEGARKYDRQIYWLTLAGHRALLRKDTVPEPIGGRPRGGWVLTEAGRREDRQPWPRV